MRIQEKSQDGRVEGRELNSSYENNKTTTRTEPEGG